MKKRLKNSNRHKALLLLALTACSQAAANTSGVAPTPLTEPSAHIIYRAGKGCLTRVSRSIDGTRYIGCTGGKIVAMRRGTIVASTTVAIYGVQEIRPAGDGAIAVLGFNDGATLRSALVFLRARTLQPLSDDPISDATFLGMLGDRAYVDDWCCNGRPDAYEPATIYSISMRDGSTSRAVDLAPDRDEHAREIQPLGQGEHNYMIGHYFYVVVGAITYRYDLLDLGKPPLRLASVVAT